MFKLKKDFFGWEKDAYIVCVYMRNNQSTRESINDGPNCYDIVLDKMSTIPDDSMIFAMGDWNGRVGERSEVCFESIEDVRISDNEHVMDWILNEQQRLFTKDDFLCNNINVQRMNEDKTVNDYGVKLLNLCDAVDLCILNGRCFNDKKREVNFLQQSGQEFYRFCFM